MKWAILLILVGSATAQVITGFSGTGGRITAPGVVPLQIDTIGLPAGVVGTSYSQTLAASGGATPYSWSLFSPTHTATLNWTASQAPGVTDYRVSRASATGGPYTQIGLSGGALTFNDPNVVNGQTYYYVVTALTGPFESGNSNEGSGNIPATPSLPSGLSITSGGTIQGIPTTSGNSSFTVKVADSATATATKNLSISVTDAAVSAADNRYCNADGTWIGPTTDGPASLPTACINTAIANTPSTVATKTVCPVSAGSCDYTTVQAAMTAAVCGWTINIRATDTGLSTGAQLTYPEAVVLPNKVCDATHWITVQSSLTASLPAEGNRIHPCWAGKSIFGRPVPAYACPASVGVYMPKIKSVSSCVPPNPTVPTGCSKTATAAALTTGTSAYWRFIGIEFTQVPADPQIGGTIVNASSGDHIIFDRIISQGGDDAFGQSRLNSCKGVMLEGKNLALIDSYVYDIHSQNGSNGPNGIGCTDTQAVYLGGTNDDATFGTIKVVDTFLESAGENFFSGGGAATVTPSNFEIRRNHSFKPTFWKRDCTPTLLGCEGYQWYGTWLNIKNLGEFKNASKVLIEGNIASHNWQGDTDQKGTGFVVTPKNQSGQCPICTVNNLTIRYNKIEHVQIGIGMALAPASEPPNPLAASLYNLSLHDNLLDDVVGDTWSSKPAQTAGASAGQGFGLGTELDSTKVHDFVIDHNTSINFVTPNISLSQGSTAGLIRIASGTNGTPNQIGNLTITNNIGAGGGTGGNPGAPGFATAQCPGQTGGVALTLNDCAGTTWCYDGNVLASTVATFPSLRANLPFPNNTPYNPSDPATGSPACNRPLVGNPMNVTDWNAFKFVNFNNGSGGDYRLCTAPGSPSPLCTAASPYLNSSTDGRQPGADINAVNAATAGVQ